MADTNRLVLPLLAASQAQKHVTVNEALKLLDAIIQAGVIDKDLTAPPGSPSEGDIYIVGASATGDWAGQDDDLAIYQDGAWVFVTPLNGFIAFVADESTLYVFNSSWTSLAGILGASYLPLAGGTMTGNLVLEEATPSIRMNDTDITGYTLIQTVGAKFQISVDAEGDDASSSFAVAIDGSDKIEVNQYGLGVGGASADATNGFSFYGTNMLFNSGSDIAGVFNKSGAGDDASFTFQQGFTTYAQMGLLGNNDWTLKVGTGATTAIVADESTGAVDLTQHPKFSAYVNYDQYNAADAWFTVAMNNTRHNDQGAFDASTDNDFTAPHDGYYCFGGGITHKLNGTAPTYMAVGISVNGATPTADTIQKYTADMTDGEASVQTTAFLKLSSGDTVELQAYFATNDGYVEADTNYFWGHQVA